MPEDASDWPPLPHPERFEFRAVLGAGSAGEVYHVHDLDTGQELALKRLARPEPELLLLLKREFHALADIVHTNLVRLYDLEVGESDGYFTMELVEGQPLDRAVADASPAVVQGCFRQLAEALSVLHGRGLVHRDVKPANTLVEPSGRTVLLDLGLAVGLETELSLINAGELAGTLAYMAPEQAWGQPVSPAADWYSFGVMLYECLNGDLPFQEPGLGGLLNRQHRTPKEMDDPTVAAHPALAQLALDLLAFAPDERPTGEEVQERLSEQGSPVPRSAPRPSLIGRKAELGRLSAAFERARGGELVAVEIEGASGIGKTTLVEHFLRDLEQGEGALVLRSRCHPQAAIRFEAIDGWVDDLSRFLDWLDATDREVFRPRGVPALVQVFPMLGQVGFDPLERDIEAADADPGEIRRLGFAALSEMLSRIADRRPLVLWIDDAQWGDADSGRFLAELLEERVRPGLLLLLTHRGEAERGALFERLATDESQGAKTVTVGHDIWVGYSGVFVAQEMGYFKEAGLEVELKPFSNPGDTLPALVAGKLDIGLTTLQNLAVLNGNQTTDIVGIAVLDSSNGADAIVTKEDIKSVADLKGKTVAVTLGEVNHMLLLLGLKKAGMSSTDVKITSMSADDAGAAFVAGRVDAAVTWEPWVTKARTNGGNVVFTSADVPDTIMDTVAVRSGSIATEKATYASFLAAIDKGVQYLRAEPAKSHVIIGKYLDASAEDVAGMLSGDKIYDLADNKGLFGSASAPGPLFQSMQSVVDFAKESELIKKTPKGSDLLDGSFIR